MQIKVQSSPSQSTKQETLDPLTVLYLSTDKSGGDNVRVVRVQDGDSQPHYAEVQVQGVPAEGIVDSGANIVIMGTEIFKKVATANKIKKKAFHKPDKVPHTYDQKVFTLDGYLQLDISFGDKTMQTCVYVKVDTHDQLLLSEGVCRQLGVLAYHPDVKPKKIHPQKEEASAEVATVSSIRVCLLQSVRIPARQSSVVPVHVQGNFPGKSVLLEQDSSLNESTGLVLDDVLVLTTEDEVAGMRISNPSSFTAVLEKGTVLGQATEVSEVSASESEEIPVQQEPPSEIRKISVEAEDKRKQKLLEKLEEPDLPEPEKTILCNFLTENHLAFSLEDGELGETDLVEMVIDTDDTTPKKQPTRRMPFAARSEIARQLKSHTALEIPLVESSRISSKERRGTKVLC